MKKLYKYIIFILISLSILVFNLLVSQLGMDEIWNYGFSYNIVTGLIPYKDFNMVLTPFYFMFMAIFMIFSKSFVLFHVVNSFILTMLLFVIHKLIKEKTYIILPLLLFPICLTPPNYNMFILFLFVLLLYFEKENKNDYLIGVLLSIIFLTKQSIGIFLIPVSLYYIKQNKKVLKRFIGFIIPIIIFIIYLLITNSYREFIDLCILGLFDFGKKNTNINIFFIIPVVLIVLLLISMRKNKNIYNYYLLGFASMCAPLFDLYHIQVYVLAYLLISIMNGKKLFKPKLIGITLFIGVLCIHIIKNNMDFNNYPNNINTFKYRYIAEKGIDTTNEVLNYMNKYNNKVMFVGPVAYYYKLAANEKITKLDLINEGNLGYNGSNRLLEEVKKLDDDYVFFINKNNDPDTLGTQTDKKLVKYILKNYKKIDETKHYDIYIK